MTLPMTIPIKFRGKDINGHYVYGLLTKKKNRNSGKLSYAIASGNFTQGETIPVDEKSVSQLVGYDKNGKELYAGDPVADQYGEGWVNIRALVGHTGGAIGKVFEDYELKESADNEKG